jgi:hypothetical protein
LFNEWYSRDISKKRRLTNFLNGNEGIPLSPPPYGYMKDPENAKRWVIDPEPAEVVRRIFAMTLDGFGTAQIAAALEREKILTPMHYWAGKGIKRPNKGGLSEEPYKWNYSTVVYMLSAREYCGDVVNFKTYSKSYKLKKRIKNSEENIKIFEGVHEAVIERETWELVQSRRGKARKRKTNDGEKNMFSGLVVCADCGHNLWYHFNQGNPEITYFNCSNYKGNRGACESTHYVRVDFLEQAVLGEIRRLTRFASRYEDEFLKILTGFSQKNAESRFERKQKELCALTARDKEIDRLFNRMYEDNEAGKLDDARFSRMKQQYDGEQAEIAEKIKVLRAELEKTEEKAMTTDAFRKIVRKYTRAKKLSERMLNELIEKIEVYRAYRRRRMDSPNPRTHKNPQA